VATEIELKERKTVGMKKRRKLLMAMLDAVYVDTVEEKSVVAIWPKPAFRPIFEIATTREGSGIALINQTPQTQDEPEPSGLCSWWRRGESNYTENAGWRCWWRRSFIRVTISRATSRYLPRHGSHLLEQFPHRLAGGLSCHPAAHSFAYLALFDCVIIPHQLDQGGHDSTML